jgi:hypothetical protein
VNDTDPCALPCREELDELHAKMIKLLEWLGRDGPDKQVVPLPPQVVDAGGYAKCSRQQLQGALLAWRPPVSGQSSPR